MLTILLTMSDHYINENSMCSLKEKLFFQEHTTPQEFTGKRILEVGSRYINGTIRTLVEPHNPSLYIGLDLILGNCVDVVFPAERMMEIFYPEEFDVAISMACVEHVDGWKTIISNMKKVLKVGGLIIVETCTPRFPLHDYPSDYWRYTTDDMVRIFSDFEILVNETFPVVNGDFIFLKARKPEDWKECSYDGVKLYSIKTKQKEDR
jgi:SAM-dependent methyltransferase